jgi:hypothetical protein
VNLHFDGHSQVRDFIQTLTLYGGYNELADILVNLTSLAIEMGHFILVCLGMLDLFFSVVLCGPID